MTSVLIKNIEEMINNHIGQYILLISKEYNIKNEELLKLWDNFDKNRSYDIKPLSSSVVITTPLTIEQPKKSVSIYVNFCNQHRSKLKSDNPNMSFGDISKELGKMWRNLNPNEKKKYEVTRTKNVEMNNNENEDISKKTLSELRELCDSLEIKKNGNKSNILNRIQEHYKNNKKETREMTVSISNPLILYEEIVSTPKSSISSSSIASSTSFILDNDDNDLNFDD